MTKWNLVGSKVKVAEIVDYIGLIKYFMGKTDMGKYRCEYFEGHTNKDDGVKIFI